MGRITAQDIRDREFKQSPLGYNRDQVNQFLDELAEELEKLIQESNTIHLENKEARLVLKTYLNVEDSLKETLLVAQKTARETQRNAQNEADTILHKANNEKDALLFSAKEDLSMIQNDIQRLHVKRDAMLIKLKSILRTNLELLDDEFSDDEGVNEMLHETVTAGNERILDFSKSDMLVEDLSDEDEQPEIIIDETVDFREE